jgi:hypothetical protein
LFLLLVIVLQARVLGGKKAVKVAR